MKRRGARRRRKRWPVMLLAGLAVSAAVMWGLWRLAYRAEPESPGRAAAPVTPQSGERIEPAEQRLLEEILKSRRGAKHP